ncbi:hypothetical protein A0H81_10331 [Grifola frondosa]|uniref:Uncharacterized protein n=1 Tax=Grifola frondosa TaxID=5627 RepID=A0A1C7LY89_GRIFR|nr:hypothetical protein A0H81_10331 [Grifola frondosa]
MLRSSTSSLSRFPNCPCSGAIPDPSAASSTHYVSTHPSSHPLQRHSSVALSQIPRPCDTCTARICDSGHCATFALAPPASAAPTCFIPPHSLVHGGMKYRATRTLSCVVLLNQGLTHTGIFLDDSEPSLTVHVHDLHPQRAARDLPLGCHLRRELLERMYTSNGVSPLSNLRLWCKEAISQTAGPSFATGIPVKLFKGSGTG